jgi:carboxyl-terminal processing protease
VMADFKAFLKAKNVEVSDTDLQANIDWVHESIKSDLFTSQFGQVEGMKVRAQWDPQIQKSLGFMPQAQALEERLTKAKPTTTASR